MSSDTGVEELDRSSKSGGILEQDPESIDMDAIREEALEDGYDDVAAYLAGDDYIMRLREASSGGQVWIRSSGSGYETGHRSGRFGSPEVEEYDTPGEAFRYFVEEVIQVGELEEFTT